MKSAKTRCVAWIAVAASSAFAAGSAQAQQLWRVGTGASADFATIQDAVDAAADGDVVFVDFGAFAGFQIVGKGLTVVGYPNGATTITSPISVRQTVAGETIVLAELAELFTTAGGQSGLLVQSCAGAVRVQDCTLVGQLAPTNALVPGAAGARIESSNDAIFSACTATGGNGSVTYSGGSFPGETPWGGGGGIDVASSQLALYQCSATAGVPGVSHLNLNLFGADGGSGLTLDGAFLFSTSVLMKGGKGGSQSISAQQCMNYGGLAAGCGNGGNGLRLVGAASNAYVQQPNLAPGPGGTTNCYAYYNGSPGKPFFRQAPGSLARRVNGTPRTLLSAAIVTGTSTVNFTANGAPGDLVYAIVESGPHFQYDAALHGVWSLSYPPQPSAAPDAVVGASGSVGFPLTLPALQAGQEARTWFVQAYVVDTSGQTTASTPRSVTIAQ